MNDGQKKKMTDSAIGISVLYGPCRRFLFFCAECNKELVLRTQKADKCPECGAEIKLSEEYKSASDEAELKKGGDKNE